MKVKQLFTKAMTFADDHQREILLGCTIVGVISTGITAWRNAPKARDIIEEHKKVMDEIPEDDKDARRQETFDTAKELAPLVLPPVVLGGLTIFCAVGGHSASTKQIAALSAAYNMSEKALADYTEKAKELLGDKKVQQVKDAVNVDKVTTAATPIKENILATGNGTTICYDTTSGRYFYSNAEAIKKACNDINLQMMNEYYVSLNELYDAIGLPSIALGDELGFNIDNGLIDIEHIFTAHPMEVNGITEPVLILNLDEYISTKYMENRGRIIR